MEKQESINIEGSDPEGAIIRNKSQDGEISTMVVINWLEKMDGSGDNIDAPLCSKLYKEEGGCLFPCSGIDPDAKMNCITWSNEENDWIVPEDHYNEEFKNY